MTADPSWQDRYRAELATPEQAVGLIRAGRRILFHRSRLELHSTLDDGVYHLVMPFAKVPRR